MTARTETGYEALDRCHADQFTGSLVIHMSNGVEERIEQKSSWRPPKTNGTVDLTEATRPK